MSGKRHDIAVLAFWLVAFVVVAHVIAVFLAEGACIYYADEIMAGKADCNSDGKLSELLAAALAAALAFAGGRAYQQKSDDKEGEQ